MCVATTLKSLLHGSAIANTQYNVESQENFGGCTGFPYL